VAVGARRPLARLAVDDERLERIALAFAAVVDAKSPWTYHHSDRTSLVAAEMGEILGFPPDQLDDLRRVALMHDIGKLAISNRILDKPARLSAAELARVRQHPLFTQWILELTPGFRSLAPLAAAHHERLDGHGYPHGLTARELTLPMRILAVADVYEALTAERPYRQARSSAQALEEMRPEVPKQLDGRVFGALEAVLEERRPAPSADTVLGRFAGEP
jgi:HD-GYP domain-containing protein (c-di-GMP phosphodiesterase class II)